MEMTVSNKEKFFSEELQIWRREFHKTPVAFSSKEEVYRWLDETDLIQVLAEDFDYILEIKEERNFTNEEFSTAFYNLYDQYKKELVDLFYEKVTHDSSLRQ